MKPFAELRMIGVVSRTRVLDRVVLAVPEQCAQCGEALPAEAGPGDFIYVPPYVPHQEINASRDEPLECVLVRSDNEAVVVNLDIEPAEKPEDVAWIDPIHKAADKAAD